MTGIPDDATRTGIWAEVPCRTCHGHGELIHPTEHRPINCNHCNGRGVRVVITDVEVEQRVLFDHRGNEADPVWREVQP